MALSWHKTLVYFGLAEERDPEFENELDAPRRRDRSRGGGAQRSRGARAEDFDDIFGDDDDDPPTRAVLRPVGGRGSGRGPNGGSRRVHLVIPKSFNDAQQIADRFRDEIPVVINLQNTDSDLSKRLIDFASGLTYGLDGGMQKVAERVFMLTPRNVEVSAEERAQLIEKGFFNQS